MLLVGVASTALGAVTWAQFSDSDASDGNAVEAGTLNITFDGADSQTSSFSLTNAKPGDTASHEFALRNAGSLAADHVEVGVSFSENDVRDEPSDAELGNELSAGQTASYIKVTTLEYRNSSGTVIEDALSNVGDGNNNGITDLEDARNQAIPLDDLPAPQSDEGNETYLVIGLQIVDDNNDGGFTENDEDIMADGIDVKFTFTLNQDSSQ